MSVPFASPALPLHAAMTAADVDRVCDAVSTLIAEARR